MQQCTHFKHRDSDGRGIVIVGDDQCRLEDAFDQFTDRTSDPGTIAVTAAGNSPRDPGAVNAFGNMTPIEQPNLGDALNDEDVQRSVLAFHEGNRDRFFRTLRVCQECGIEAVAPANQAQKVLIEETRGEWIVVDLEPLSPRQRRLKRLFDIVFATIGLLALAPLIVIIAAAIKLDSQGPVLYRQQRSGLLGQSFLCCKFRTMYTGSENAIPMSDADIDRITPVGRVLRKTHMDEIPQLWPILRGEMTAVGPRAAWIEEEEILKNEVEEWQKRWFVKPGLTGLAQINGVGSTDARAKLRHDLEYIRRQSLLFDVWIVTVQVWTILSDLIELLERIPRSRDE